MDTAKFYGATSSKPNLRYLQSAKDLVEASSSQDLEIVLLPPDSGDQPIESDEEGDDNVLDEDYFPQETAGEVEIHGGEFDEDEIDGNISKSSRWKKTENLSLSDVDPLTGQGDAHILQIKSGRKNQEAHTISDQMEPFSA